MTDISIENGMTVSEIIKVVRAHKKLFISLPLLCSISVFVFMPDSASLWEATSYVQIGQANQPIESPAAAAIRLRSPSFHSELKKRLPGAELDFSVSAAQAKGTELVEVKAVARSGETAVQVAQVASEMLVEFQNRDLEGRLASVKQTLSALDTAIELAKSTMKQNLPSGARADLVTNEALAAHFFNQHADNTIARIESRKWQLSDRVGIETLVLSRVFADPEVFQLPRSKKKNLGIVLAALVGGLIALGWATTFNKWTKYWFNVGK